jgi:hypothetical protein
MRGVPWKGALTISIRRNQKLQENLDAFLLA